MEKENKKENIKDIKKSSNIKSRNNFSKHNRGKKESNIINKSVEFNLLEVVLIILITGILVSITSGLIVYNNYDKLEFSSITGSSSSYEFKEFVEHYNTIVNNYIDEVDKEELLDAAIEGMYNYLGDDYSMYMSADDTNTLEEQLVGEYEGIGVEITSFISDEEIFTYITKVFENTPAQNAGLLPGDRFVSLDGVDLRDKDAEYVSNTIKYGEKASFELVVLRDEKEVKVTINRDHVYINSVHSKVDGNVGYIQIETFSSTTKEQVKKAIDSFEEDVTSLVIDVRDNTGGYLNSAYETSDLFINKGEIIYQLKDKNEIITKYEALEGIYRHFDKIAVIVNNSSASASEILAIALKEKANAIIVGATSYGKGTVQETKTLSSGAMVKYTTAYWLSPNGNSINEIGIEPDIVVENIDEQYSKAIEAVK